MRVLTITSAFVMLFSVAAVAQKGPCTEQAIRDAISKHDPNWVTDDFYFFSPAFNKPLITISEVKEAGQKVAQSRDNETHDPYKPDRIVVALSGDMAYEYGTHHLSFDEKQNGKHQDFTNAYLRVWRAVDSSCKAAAVMLVHEGERH